MKSSCLRITHSSEKSNRKTQTKGQNHPQESPHGTEVPATHLCPFFPGQAWEPLFTGGARGPRVATLAHGTSFPGGTLQGKSVSAGNMFQGHERK